MAVGEAFPLEKVAESPMPPACPERKMKLTVGCRLLKSQPSSQK